MKARREREARQATNGRLPDWISTVSVSVPDTTGIPTGGAPEAVDGGLRVGLTWRPEPAS